MRRLVVPLLVLLVACAEPLPPLAGVDLPPASMPEVIEPSSFSIAFIHEFDDGFWDEGEHVYQLSLDCPPIMDEPLNTPPLFFEVARLVLPVDHVYLRLGGLSDSRIGPINLAAFNMQQPTSAIVTIIGVSETNANDAIAECVGQVSWDLSGSADLVPLEPFKP